MNIDKKNLKPTNYPMSFVYRKNNYVALCYVSGIYDYPHHPKVLQGVDANKCLAICCLWRGDTSVRNYAQVYPATGAGPLTTFFFLNNLWPAWATK